AYWRFDEGAGQTVFDQHFADGQAHNGTLGGGTWVTSDAPVGENPGIQRASFSFAGRTIESAPTALFYYQQETAAAGYGQAKPLKQNARVMMAVATKGAGSKPNANEIASLDFAVSREGRMARIRDVITLPQTQQSTQTAKPTIADQLQTISTL